MEQVEQEWFEHRNDGATGRNVRIDVAPAQRPTQSARREFHARRAALARADEARRDFPVVRLAK